MGYKIRKENDIFDITFDLKTEYQMFENKRKENYSYSIVDGILILTYNSCRDKEKMKEFIDIIKYKENEIKAYIIDLRGNVGGDNKVIEPLLEFLKGKKIVTLINEYVFSSGRHACMSLKTLGSYFIGTNIGTTVNAFGNNPKPLRIQEYDFTVGRSTKYFFYNNNVMESYDKSDFVKRFLNKDVFSKIEQVIFKPDEYVEQSLKDYINNKDVILERAIKYLEI